MRIPRPDLSACRAVIAVAALYALALQSVLAGMVGARSPDPAHILCLQDGSAPESGSDSAPPVHVHLACCTAAYVAPLLAAPVLATAAVVWPLRRGVAMRWRPEVVAAPRAPPGVSASARAPPVV